MEAMGEWTLLRSHRSYKQNRGTKRSTRRCSFQWYKRRPSNSNRATNARQCGADDSIFVFVRVWSEVGGFEFPFLATAHFLARKYCWRRTVRRDRFGGPQFPKFIHNSGFGGPQFPKFLFPPRCIPTYNLIWIETKNLALKVYCGHLAANAQVLLSLFSHKNQSSIPKIYIRGLRCI